MNAIRDEIGGREVEIAFPDALVGAQRTLLEAEKAEFEAVFGAPIRFVEAASAGSPSWTVQLDSTLEANILRWDRATLSMVSRVKSPEGWASTMQMLHSLVTLDVDEVSDAPGTDLAAAVARIEREIVGGFPGFEIRGLSWPDLRAEFPPNERMSVPDLARLIALLQDGHTGVRRQGAIHHPPYAVAFEGGTATMRRVPDWSAAAEAGVEEGWTLDVGIVSAGLEGVGATDHSRSLLVGRRAIALQGDESRRFVATSPEGVRRSWVETTDSLSIEQLFEVSALSGDALYVRLHNWFDDRGLDEQLDAALSEHRDRKLLVMDLRGNTGGSLVMAQRWRRRFLRTRTLLGTIRFTRGDGTLADHAPLWDEPDAGERWEGRLAVLTDPLTYSASEDFLHGLQGLDHVTVIGVPSGGGSGRPRTIPLIPGWNVTVSTALTFDRTGHCIEGQGVPIDIASDPFTEDWRSELPHLLGQCAG